MMLVDLKIDGRPVTMLFDTGARRTLVSTRSLGVDLPMQAMAHHSYERGFEGQIIETRVNMLLGGQEFPVDVMAGNLDRLAATMGTDKCDGLLGEDILSQYRSFTINRRSRMIDFER